MLKIYLYSNPNKLYQKLISFLFNTKYYHIEYELEFCEENYFLRSYYDGNFVSNEYLSYLVKDTDIYYIDITKEQSKKILEYFIKVNNTKYNYKDILKWFFYYKILKKDINYFKNNNKINKYNCFNHFINIDNIIKNKKIFNIIEKEIL